ncbi:MAG: hypothetical protein ACFCD0_11170 [Gemmataceae bacterium]
MHIRIPLFLASALFLHILTAGAGLADQSASDKLKALYKSGDLFDRKNYIEVRNTFAQLFEAQFQTTIRQAFGEDHQALSEWFDKHPAIKGEFYNALNLQYDRLPQALAVFRSLWKKHTDKVEKFPELAIAIAVVWDDPSRGVYTYRGHQIRTKSQLPDQLVDAIGNFEYITGGSKQLQTRGRYLPWEFLVFIVDHRTPIKERNWAQLYFQQWQQRYARRLVKGVHQDVPYDMEMLKFEKSRGSQGRFPKLKGHLYTLKNIKSFGGVCAHQADFACRVGKSVGMPGVYCSGKSAYRGRHAWWMFVQLRKVSAKRIDFTLVSDGRYLGFVKDKFYTGQALDPCSGKRILDRDMERRLSMTGKDRTAKRQADLIMRAYRGLCQHLKLDAKARVNYLQQCLRVSNYNEAAWREMIKLGLQKTLDENLRLQVRKNLYRIPSLFGPYPDFVWGVLDDLAAVQEKDSDRVKLLHAAASSFERKQRPDLACAARLKATTILVKHKKYTDAANNLARTIRKFPTEGRHIPEAMLELQRVAQHIPKGSDKVGKLYLELIPTMIRYYRDDKNPYCQQLVQQALKYFEEAELTGYREALLRQSDIAKILNNTSRR